MLRSGRYRDRELSSREPDDDDDTAFVAGPTMDVVEVEECVTSLLFPFVTNMYGYDTGIAITNTSAAKGTCISNGPAAMLLRMMVWSR